MLCKIVLTLWLLSNFSCFYAIHWFEKFFQEYHQCLDPDQADILSGLIWVQTICKGYQQTTIVGKKLTYQAQQNVVADLDLNCLTFWWYSWKFLQEVDFENN